MWALSVQLGLSFQPGEYHPRKWGRGYMRRLGEGTHPQVQRIQDLHWEGREHRGLRLCHMETISALDQSGSKKRQGTKV